MNLKFKPIEFRDMPIMQPFYEMRPNRTCDSTFLESFIWKDYYRVEYAIWENRALLWIAEMDGKKFSAMPLCRPEDLPDAFHAIEQYFNENLGYPLVINLADEYAVNLLNLPEDKYRVEEQVDSRDYIYSGDSLRTLAGKKMHKKKNRLNVFTRAYEGRYEYRRLACSDSHRVWEFLDKWREQKDEDEEHLDYEAMGVHDILKNCVANPGAMGGVFIDGELEAFTIGSYNPVEKMAVIHVEKANPTIDGLYQFINREFLLDAFPQAELVNREDDMGLEGLRKSKMSYNPVTFARKFLVQQLVDGKKGYQWAEHIDNTTLGPAYEYLADEDKGETERLYHECFPEDSQAFTDYYYTEKMKKNRVLVKKDSGLLVSMVHLNPYPVDFRGRHLVPDYLVAVGTASDRRREGNYRDTFEKLLNDQHEEKKPFTYLVPVNPKVYEPLGFVFAGNVVRAELTEAGKTLSRREVTEDKADLDLAAAYMTKWLDARYEFHTVRDRVYVADLRKEMASENGTLEFLYDGERLVGLRAEWGLAEREQYLLYADDPYAAVTGVKPWNMARCTDAAALLGLFTREGEAADAGTETAPARGEGTGGEAVASGENAGAEAADFALSVEVSDPLIAGNNGIFRWTKDNVRQEEAADLPLLRTDQSGLIRFLLAGEPAAEVWPDTAPEVLEQLNRVPVVKGVCLDELV
jgi:hypothetical protein